MKSKFLTFFDENECYKIKSIRETKCLYIVTSDELVNKKRLRKDEYNKKYLFFDFDENYNQIDIDNKRAELIREILNKEVKEYIKTVEKHIDDIFIKNEKRPISIGIDAGYFRTELVINFETVKEELDCWEMPKNIMLPQYAKFKFEKLQYIIDKLAERYKLPLKCGTNGESLNSYIDPAYIDDIGFYTTWSQTIMYIVFNRNNKITVISQNSSSNLAITLDDLVEYRPDLIKKLEDTYTNTDAVIFTPGRIDLIFRDKENNYCMAASYIAFPFFNNIIKKLPIKIEIYGYGSFYLNEDIIFDVIRIKDSIVYGKRTEKENKLVYCINNINKTSSKTIIKQLKQQLGREKFKSLLLISELDNEWSKNENDE